MEACHVEVGCRWSTVAALLVALAWAAAGFVRLERENDRLKARVVQLESKAR